MSKKESQTPEENNDCCLYVYEEKEYVHPIFTGLKLTCRTMDEFEVAAWRRDVEKAVELYGQDDVERQTAVTVDCFVKNVSGLKGFFLNGSPCEDIKKFFLLGGKPKDFFSNIVFNTMSAEGKKSLFKS